MTEVYPGSERQGVLYVIVCAAPPAQQIRELVVLAQAAQWEVCVIATPQATRFIDAPALTTLTGYPVRSEYKLPGEADALPKANAMVVVPATFNTINKWALGIGDTLAASILCESLGRGTPPIVAVPYLKHDLARHPAFARNLAVLREHGVRILYEPDTYPSPLLIPWKLILEALCDVHSDKQ
jgi:phosphopantothenoylcysteine synthetase/decarboxylase